MRRARESGCRAGRVRRRPGGNGKLGAQQTVFTPSVLLSFARAAAPVRRLFRAHPPRALPPGGRRYARDDDDVFGGGRPLPPDRRAYAHTTGGTTRDAHSVPVGVCGVRVVGKTHTGVIWGRFKDVSIMGLGCGVAPFTF